MTEQQWLAATDPGPMLDWLPQRGALSERKARLFAVAACRNVWHLLTEGRSRMAVGAAERFADGQAAAGELLAAYRAARDPADVYHEEAAAAAAHDDAGHAAAWAAEAAAYGPDEPAWRRHYAAQRAAQADLLRCLVGPLPFRPVTLPAPVLAWNAGGVVRLATSIYEERKLPEGTLDNARLAVLADALEEAGCDDVDLLGHVRGPGPHVRGCWVLDAILGKA